MLARGEIRHTIDDNKAGGVSTVTGSLPRRAQRVKRAPISKKSTSAAIVCTDVVRGLFCFFQYGGLGVALQDIGPNADPIMLAALLLTLPLASNAQIRGPPCFPNNWYNLASILQPWRYGRGVPLCVPVRPRHGTHCRQGVRHEFVEKVCPHNTRAR